MTFAEQSPDQRGAQLLAWYMGQWGAAGMELDDASVMLVTDVLAYSRSEGEVPEDICAAAQASLTFQNHEDGER